MHSNEVGDGDDDGSDDTRMMGPWRRSLLDLFVVCRSLPRHLIIAVALLNPDDKLYAAAAAQTHPNSAARVAKSTCIDNVVVDHDHEHHPFTTTPPLLAQRRPPLVLGSAPYLSPLTSLSRRTPTTWLNTRPTHPPIFVRAIPQRTQQILGRVRNIRGSSHNTASIHLDIILFRTATTHTTDPRTPAQPSSYGGLGVRTHMRRRSFATRHWRVGSRKVE